MSRPDFPTPVFILNLMDFSANVLSGQHILTYCICCQMLLSMASVAVAIPLSLINAALK